METKSTLSSCSELLCDHQDDLLGHPRTVLGNQAKAAISSDGFHSLTGNLSQKTYLHFTRLSGDNSLNQRSKHKFILSTNIYPLWYWQSQNALIFKDAQVTCYKAAVKVRLNLLGRKDTLLGGLWELSVPLCALDTAYKETLELCSLCPGFSYSKWQRLCFALKFTSSGPATEHAWSFSWTTFQTEAVNTGDTAQLYLVNPWVVWTRVKRLLLSSLTTFSYWVTTSLSTLQVPS